MKRSILFFLSSFCLLAATLPAAASDPDYKKIADRIVNQSLEIKPGEYVVIAGTPAEIPIMKEVYIAVEKAGGEGEVQLFLRDAEKRLTMELSADVLAMGSDRILTRMQDRDAMVLMGSTQDPKLYADVPEEKLAALRKASENYMQAIEKSSYRHVYLGQAGGIPTKAYAKYWNAKYPEMISMFWRAVNTDSGSLRKISDALNEYLKSGSTIHVTSNSGTDLHFSLDSKPGWTNIGVASAGKVGNSIKATFLPAGINGYCVDPDSANGKVVIPSSRFRGEVVHNLELDFKNGRITSIKADRQEKEIQRYFNSSGGDTGLFSYIQIGFNPNSKPMNNSDYYSSEMAGMVTLSTGDATIEGCDVKAPGAFNMRVAGADLKIGGDFIIQDGALRLAAN